MKTYSIGQLAERCGIATQAIRYYEQERLMPNPQRTESNYRRYPEAHVARLRFILQAKQWGFTLDEIRELLILQDATGHKPSGLPKRSWSKFASSSSIFLRSSRCFQKRSPNAQEKGPCRKDALLSRQ